jgi:hypothetical protein
MSRINLFVNVGDWDEVLVFADFPVDPHFVVADVVDVGPRRLVRIESCWRRFTAQNIIGNL